MILKNSDYDTLAKKIKDENLRIVVYGAGMIGQIIVPYLISEYGLWDYLDCFVDYDKRKTGKKIRIGDREYCITTPNYLSEANRGFVLLITNSNFYPIVEFLDGIPALEQTEGYLVPIMQICDLKRKNDSRIFERNTAEQIIPKKINYCWFGRGKMPNQLAKCIDSWRMYCPDYEIVEWNEDNYDVNRHAYTKEAYAHGKYGFVSDVARLDILYENGGLYLDTDVTLLRSLDELLYHKGFIGTEKWGNINSGGGCGFIKEHPMLKEILNYRERFCFEFEDGSLNTETNGLYETVPFINSGYKPCNRLQHVGDVLVLPSYVNHPYDYMSCQLNKRETTVSVHQFYGGWMEEDERLHRLNTQSKYDDIMNRIERGGYKDL